MVSDVYFPRVNGVSTSIQTFRDVLRRHHVDVTLVAPDYPGAEPEEGVLRLPSRPVPLDPEDRLMHWSELRTLERRLASTDFHLVHVQTPFAAHYGGLRLARGLGLPCIATYHTHFEEYLFHYIPFVPRAGLRLFARSLARHQCNALDAVVVPSQPMADTLHGYGVSAPLRVIPTGMPAAQFERGDGAAFRHRHGIAAERPIALFVGRAAHEKNIGFLLEVIAHARQRRPDLMLVIAGEGPALPSLRRIAEVMHLESHVRFVGYLDRATELRDCYAAADVFTFASLTETQGLVLLEAMAVGLPVLAISALGTRAIVEPQRGAIKAADVSARFAIQLVDLLADPGRLVRMGADGREFAREWSADRPAAELANLYRELHRPFPAPAPSAMNEARSAA